MNKNNGWTTPGGSKLQQPELSPNSEDAWVDESEDENFNANLPDNFNNAAAAVAEVSRSDDRSTDIFPLIDFYRTKTPTWQETPNPSGPYRMPSLEDARPPPLQAPSPHTPNAYAGYPVIHSPAWLIPMHALTPQRSFTAKRLYSDLSVATTECDFTPSSSQEDIAAMSHSGLRSAGLFRTRSFLSPSTSEGSEGTNNSPFVRFCLLFGRAEGSCSFVDLLPDFFAAIDRTNFLDSEDISELRALVAILVDGNWSWLCGQENVANLDITSKIERFVSTKKTRGMSSISRQQHKAFMRKLLSSAVVVAAFHDAKFQDALNRDPDANIKVMIENKRYSDPLEYNRLQQFHRIVCLTKRFYPYDRNKMLIKDVATLIERSGKSYGVGSNSSHSVKDRVAIVDQFAPIPSWM